MFLNIFIYLLAASNINHGHLLQDEVKHEDEATEVHVVIITVQIQGAVTGGVSQVFEGAAA